MNALEMATGVFGWALVHSVWQILVIAAAVKFLLYLFRGGSSTLKYNLVLGGLALMVIAFGITLYLAADRLPESGGSLIGSAPNNATATVADPASLQQLLNESANRFDGIFIQARRAIDESTGYIMAAWFAGFLFFVFRFFGSFAYITRLRNKYSFMLSPQWQSHLRSIQKKLRVTKGILLMESAMAAIPMVLGHLRPVIILPLGLVTHIPFNQLEAILVHELAHIRRKDYLVNLVVSTLEWVFFYHPSFWWLKHELDLYREHCCDDITIAYFGNPDPLRRALLDLSAFNQRSNHIAAALYKNDHQLLNRIKRMKTKNQKNHGTRFNPATLLLALAAIAFALLGTSLAPRQGDQWQSMSLIPLPSQMSGITGIAAHGPATISQVPDSTVDQKKAGTVKKFNDDGVVSLELDAEGNLLGVKKDGRELTGEEREKYERLVMKIQEMKEKEKALEKNQEELEKMEQRLRETEMKMKAVQKEYDQAMREYIQKHAETSWRAYDSAWGLYDDRYLEAEKLQEMIRRRQDLAGIYNRNFFEEQERWVELQDDLLRDRLADQEAWTVYRDLYEDQFRVTGEQVEKAMQEHELQWTLGNEHLARIEEELELMEELKTVDFEAMVFEEVIRQELVDDGLLDKPSDKLSFKLTGKRLVVNGEKQNARLHDKYLKIYEKHAHDDLLGDKQVIIED